MRAAQTAGLKKIPAYILHIDDEADLLELALIENIQREQLNPIEVAVAFKSLVEKCNLTQEDIAQKVGKDRATVSNFLRLLKLPQVIQVGLRRGEISMGQARALLSLRSESEQIRLFKRVVKSDITVRKLEQIVKIMTGEMLPKRKKPQNGLKYTARLESVEERLRTLFGTKVAVRARSDGRGEIVIDFYSTTDLDRLIDLIMSIDQH
jgi:ParB family chromosome partitioning protein